MRKVLITIGAIAISAAACGSQPAGTPAGGTGADTPSVAVTLPAGDVKAGRQAFMDLKCTACHAVPSEPEFPAPVSASPGPPIDARLASRDASYVMAAIMTPSHAISPDTSGEVLARLEGVLSPMGDFSHVMTVRQLIDLHAYVRSVK
jgi:hypothetical protein